MWFGRAIPAYRSWWPARLVRPDAEDRPNRLGATQADLRLAMEEAVRAVGDDRTTLVPGRDVLSPEMLGDGVHPDDAGHGVLVEVLGAAVRSAYDSPPEPT